MILDTKHTYHALVHERVLLEPRFRGYLPTNSEISRIGWALSYIAFYLAFALPTLGELFQNNHHRHGRNPSYGFLHVLALFGIAGPTARAGSQARKCWKLRMFGPLLPSRAARFSV